MDFFFGGGGGVGGGNKGYVAPPPPPQKLLGACPPPPDPHPVPTPMRYHLSCRGLPSRTTTHICYRQKNATMRLPVVAFCNRNENIPFTLQTGVHSKEPTVVLQVPVYLIVVEGIAYE